MDEVYEIAQQAKHRYFILLLRCDLEYSQFCAFFFVLGVHEISYAISYKIRLQALYWLEAVSKTILAKISENGLFALFLLYHEISYTMSYKFRLQALYCLEAVSKNILAKIS